MVEHVFESPTEIASSLKNYYTNETLKQVYKIIGSIDFAGNPTLFLSSVMSGVKDLVSAPTAAFMKSPANVKQVGIGVGKGTVSLVSHSASGFFGFTARLFSQAGQATAFFSLDPDYRQWHRDRIVNEATNLDRAWKRRGMLKVEEIVLRPVADVFLGFSLGISGVVMSPYRGARKAGTRGFFAGTGVGIAGLVTKPIVGVFDALTHGSQSIHDIAKTANFLERRYQPVLKLRLPYVFGPMKILTPFDAISARSVYLLGLFPPKMKFKRRSDKGRELHVHSEVLNMEPGVETYAIATTIRVILINLKRDNANALSPIFGWEVELSSAAIISSRISDHGHNGVALTITKCDDLTMLQNGKRENKRILEIPKKAKLPSALSYLPVQTTIEGDEDDEEVGDLGENFQTSGSTSTTKPFSESVSAGVTKKGNKTLEWFTVLAEYQQREQLTQLHNAISCILGEYDAMTSERAQIQGHDNDVGTTSFGIYHFEKGLPDGRAAKVSNTKVIASLENLYWMEQSLAQRIGSIGSPSRKQRAVTKIRENWDFSNDMKVSASIGGPEWLVEARARAMSVSRDAQESRKSDSSFCDGSERASGYSKEQCQEDVQSMTDENSGQCDFSKVFDAPKQSHSFDGHSSSNIYGSDTDPQLPVISKIPNRKEQNEPLNELTSREDDVFRSAIASGARVDSIERSRFSSNESANNQSSQDSTGFALEHEFYSPVNGMITGTRQVEEFSSDSHQPPVASFYVPESQPPNRGASSGSLNVSRQSKTATPTASSFDSSRIDRLEGVMEQLLILNAAQVRREVAASDARARLSDTSTVHDIADTLKQELVEIREKMEERAREDEVLRQEIGMLRGQLAEKRTPASTKEAKITQRLGKNDLRPPPINTQFLKTIPIRGIFNARKKKREKKNDQQRLNNDGNGSNDCIEDVLVSGSDSSSDDTGSVPLGLNDELSVSQPMF